MEDVMWDKVREYKKMLAEAKPDMDISLLLRILDVMNSSSEVFVAHNPLYDDDSWVSDVQKYAVKGAALNDEGKFVLKTSSDKQGMHVDDLHQLIKDAMRHGLSERASIYFMRKEELVEITDAYSHTLAKDQWSGLPFDLILANVTERVSKKTDEEDAEEA